MVQEAVEEIFMGVVNLDEEVLVAGQDAQQILIVMYVYILGAEKTSPIAFFRQRGKILILRKIFTVNRFFF